MILWYKVNRDKAHAVSRVMQSEIVEFKCGKVRSFDEVKPAQFNDKQCSLCHDYIKKEGKKC